MCGKRAGLPFIEVKRVDSDKKCPAGTTPCVLSKSLQNQLCYPKNEHAAMCPITAIQIVMASELDKYRANGYTAVKYSKLDGKQTYIVYSKLEDSLPLTSFKVEYKPCLDSWQQSSSTNKTF